MLEKIFQFFKESVFKNEGEKIYFDWYKDLLFFIISFMVFYFLYGGRLSKKLNFVKLVQEYKEIYRFVVQLVLIEIVMKDIKGFMYIYFM